MTKSARSRERRLPRRLDLVGLGLFAAAVGWTYVVGGAPDVVRRTAAVFAVTAASVIVGRTVGNLAGWIVPAVIVSTACVLWVRDPAGVLSERPLEGPFGYANAKGAFFMIAAGCVLVMAALPRRPILFAIGVAALAPFALVPFASRALAPALLTVTLPLVVMVIYSLVGARTAVALAGLLFVAALLVTSFLGATYRSDQSQPTGRLITESLTDRRVALWNEAVNMMKDRPLRGVGAGRFAVLSPTARSDPDDARWAHNAFLQQGAEAGVIGLGLLVALFGWGFGRLAVSADGPSQAMVAAVLAAVAIHATVDYIMHFPAIPVAAAAVVGSATAMRKRRESVAPSGWRGLPAAEPIDRGGDGGLP